MKSEKKIVSNLYPIENKPSASWRMAFVFTFTENKSRLKIVAISDTHCRHRNIKLPKGDVLVHAGDIGYKGEKAEIEDFLQWFQAQKFEHKIFIAGNHDFYFEKAKKADIEKLIPRGVTYLNDSGVTIHGINIWGSPVTPWFFDWAFNRKRGAAIAKHWALIPPGTDLLITHGPPYGILDVVVNEQHAGCKDLLKKVLEIKPKAFICGHIHESYGTVTKHGIKFMNACNLNYLYEPTNKPLVFEL